MWRILTFVFLMSVNIYGCKQHLANNAGNIYSNKRNPDDHNVKIHVTADWIDKLRRFNYTRDDSLQLREFDSLIKPDGLTNPHTEHVDPGYGRIFNAMSVDLDSDGDDEVICLLGWDIYFPALCVFKQEDGDWFLIYQEQIETSYSSPTLYVANNFSKNKTFYFRYVDSHGTGVYEDRCSFYKMINNRVYKCLDLLNEAEGVGYQAKMNEEVKASFEFSGDDSDRVWVKYKYDFFPGSFDNNSCDWCANEDVPLIAGEAGVNYKWDKKSLTYKLDLLPYQNQVYDLTPQKIACFGTFVEDTLFVKAFKGQIDEKLKTGTPLQKKILKKYLALVKSDKK